MKRPLAAFLALWTLCAFLGCSDAEPPTGGASGSAAGDRPQAPPETAPPAGADPRAPAAFVADADAAPLPTPKPDKDVQTAAYLEPATSGSRAAAKGKAPPAAPRNPPAAPRRDPIEQNGPIFEGWPKPQLAIVLTGEQMGYIEPCGCAGLENQKGGLRRRHTFLEQLSENGWPTVAFDVGGIVSRFGRQSEIKFEKTVDALKTMGYRGVGFGQDDLKLPAGVVVAAVANSDMFLAANVGLFGFESEFTPRYRVIEAGGLKLGVTAIIGDVEQKEINNPDVQFLPARKALTAVVAELRKAKCDYLLLLSHAQPAESMALAEQFPDFDAVITAGGADEPPHEPQRVKKTEALFLEVGHKGMYAVVLGLFEDDKRPLRYQRVPLDARFKDSPEMDQLMVDYQDQLQDLGWHGLGLQPAGHPRGGFAGSQSCVDCHRAEFDVWANSPHAHATETLTGIKPPRQFDPECISCHATGWNPQEYFPFTSGFDSLKTTPLMAGNGCENCHGPAAEHVAAENTADAELQRTLRAALRLTWDEAKDEAIERKDVCIQCHDVDNSPEFKGDAIGKFYWPQVEH